MRFLHSSDVLFNDRDVVWRYSTRGPRMIAGIFFAVGAVMLALGAVRLVPWFFAIVIGAVFLGMTLIPLSIARAAAGPSGWLVAFDGRRMLVKFRSYLNAAIEPSEPSIVELSAGAIAAVARTRRTQRTVDADGDMTTEFLTFLDARLADGVDLDELKTILDNERTLGRKGLKWQAYPVSLVGDRVLRLEWRSPRGGLTPSIDDALRVLGNTFPILPESRESGRRVIPHER